MATYTGGDTTGYRKFQIGRENSEKQGTPYWMEFLPALPCGDTGARKFETRDGRVFEMFKAISGYLTGVHTEKKTFSSTETETWLVLDMEDDGEVYKVEIGKIDGRYSIDLMKRLLHPDFDPDLSLRIAPYAIDNGGRQTIGISAISGIDGKLTGRKEDTHLAGIPQPTITELSGGKKVYDFYPVASWLMQEVGSKILLKLRKDSGPMPAAESIPVPKGPKVEPQPIPDDLPF